MQLNPSQSSPCSSSQMNLIKLTLSLPRNSSFTCLLAYHTPAFLLSAPFPSLLLAPLHCPDVLLLESSGFNSQTSSLLWPHTFLGDLLSLVILNAFHMSGTSGSFVSPNYPTQLFNLCWFARVSITK